VATTLFAMLRPYREQCAAEWEGKAIPGCGTGFPGARGRWGDHGLWGIADEYLFGQDVLVAPSDNDKGAHGKWGRALVLPPASGCTSGPPAAIPPEDYGGGSAGRPAVFYRKESEFASLFDEIRKKAAV
jgi:hypothetical protein